MTNTKITIEATVLADAKSVWEKFTKPEHITKWNYASDDWHCPNASNELRPGGKYSARMEAKDGSFGFEFEAIYDEVIPQTRMTYTMSDGRKVTTVFQAQADGTKVTTTFDAENQNSVELQQQGWQAILNNFKKYVEQTSR